MNPRLLVTLLLVSFLTGCSFRSRLKIETQVYAGDTRRIEMEPDCLGLVRAVDGASEAALELKRNCLAAASRLESLAQAGQIYVSEAERVIMETAATPEYETAAWQYFNGITNLVHELAVIHGQQEADDVKLQANITAALQNQRTRFRTEDNLTTPAVAAKGIPVEAFVNDAIRKALRGKPAADQIFTSICTALLGVRANSRSQALNTLARSIRASATNALPALDAELARLGQTLQLSDFQPKTIYNPLKTAIPQSKAAASALTRRWEASDGLQAKLNQVEEIARDVTRLALEIAGGESITNSESGDKPRTEGKEAQADLYRLTAKFQRAAAEYAGAVSKALEDAQVKDLQAAWVTTLTTDLPESQLGVAAKAFGNEVTDKIAAVVAAEGEGAIDNLLFGLLGQVKLALSSAATNLSLLRSSAANAVAGIREQPFQLADPNVKTITKADNQTNWNRVPISGLRTLGDGNAQYVIAQDNPTTFRVKELSVDPSGVINLQMDVGEMAVDVLGKVAVAAASAYGVPLGNLTGSGKTGSGAAPAGTPGSPALSPKKTEDIVDAQVREMLTGLANRLRVQLSNLEDSQNRTPDPLAASRLRGILRSYEEQLGAVIRKVNEATTAPASTAAQPPKEE
jgi:hypothetical protein